MRRAGARPVRRIRPWSWHAFLLGAAVVAVSAIVQEICVVLGAELYYVAFLPGIFVIAILAGIPAAAFAVLIAIPLVWWAFVPPFFEFGALTSADAHAINLFFLFGVLLIGLADLCRETLAITARDVSPGRRDNVAPNAQ